MSKRFESRRTHGSFADLTGDKAKPIVAQCVRSSANCAPCYDLRLQETIAANKAKYKASRKRDASRSASADVGEKHDG